MIALGMRYLSGYSSAADISGLRPEWPPHPGRVFMAMVAAHFESGQDPAERGALEWLESVPVAPSISASDAFPRIPMATYVPANDIDHGLVKRTRQLRTFQKTRPLDDSVFLIWESDPAPCIRVALEQVCAKVTRIGPSSSLVQMWVAPVGDEPKATWLRDDSLPEQHLRIASPGEIARLESEFNGSAIQKHDALANSINIAGGKEKATGKLVLLAEFPDGRPESRRPRLSRWQGYSRSDGKLQGEPALTSPFDPNPLILTKAEGNSLGLETTLQLTGALRNAVLKAAPLESQPEWLTGHRADETPTADPHLAFFPLPFVGHEYADGHVMGMAIAIPRNLGNPDEQLRRHLGPLFFDPDTGAPRTVKLWRERVWKWTMERETRDRPPETLRPKTWIGPSTVWASVTPMVLHHYPKKSRPDDVERIVRGAFASALLPEPVLLHIGPVSVLTGVGHVHEMPVFDAGGERLCRYQTHVVARFRAPLTGPMLVGRGRFRGYGLFYPMATECRDRA